MSANTLETVGHNATASYSTNLTSPSWTPFSSLYDLTPNKITAAEVKTTKLDSAAETSQPGTPDFGETKITIPYNSSMSSLIQGWITSRTVLAFKLTVDDFTVTDTAETFLGWVKEFAPIGVDAKKDDPQKCDVTIRITGTGTLTAGS